MSSAQPKAGVFSEDSELKRALGLFDATMVVVGLVIGSGIFLTTGTIAASLPDPRFILLVWIAGGVLSLAGALTFAELGALMPRAGGQYVFLREAFGDLLGFLFGWTYLLVIHSGSIAAVGAGFAEYFNFFFPNVPRAVVAVIVVITLSAINARGVKHGSLVQNLSGVLKVAAILAIGIIGTALVATGRGPEMPPAPQAGGLSLTGFGVAMIAVLWTFDGWNCVTFSAGEIKNPRRNLPLALVLGTLLVTVCYVSINWVYVSVVPMHELAGTVRVAELAVGKLFGDAAKVAIVLVVLVSTFGSINGMILTGPRIYYAMSKDGLFFEALGRIHPKHQTPVAAIWTQGLWACVLAVSGQYDQLFTMVIFAALSLYALTGASLFALRVKYPDVERPYKTWGYPVTPLLYIASTFLILVNTVVEKPWESVAGCGLVALGVPAYLYWKRKSALSI